MEIFKKHDRFEVVISATGFEGKSICKHNGIVIFIEGGTEGDKVLIEILKVKKNYCEAKIIELLIPSKKRIIPKCLHFGVCGGCKWQHIQYESQLAIKEQHVKDSLIRIGGFKDVVVEKILPSTEIYYYRNKLEFSFGTSKWKPKEEFIKDEVQEKELVLGFHAPKRFDKIVHIDECFLQSELSSKILSFVRSYTMQNNLSAYDNESKNGYLRNLVIREGKFTNEVLVNFVTLNSEPEVMKKLTIGLLNTFPEITTIVNNVNTKLSNVAVGEYEIIYHGSGYIHEQIEDKLFRISSNSFFQTNSYQTQKLYNVVKEFSEIKNTDVVFDLYCGTGTIAISVASFSKKVIGVELEKSSIENGKFNAQLNKINNCEFILGDLKDEIKNIISEQSPDLIILDPPRSGIHPKVLKILNELKINRIIYVSCNPTTLARDLKILSEGGFIIEKVQPVDMFPHTYHIETVVKLKRI